jgi:hypothetical protein
VSLSVAEKSRGGVGCVGELKVLRYRVPWGIECFQLG